MHDIVDLLEISARAHNVLKSMGVRSLLDLAALSESDLRKARNCGRATIEEIMSRRLEALLDGAWLRKYSQLSCDDVVNGVLSTPLPEERWAKRHRPARVADV